MLSYKNPLNTPVYNKASQNFYLFFYLKRCLPYNLLEYRFPLMFWLWSSYHVCVWLLIPVIGVRSLPSVLQGQIAPLPLQIILKSKWFMPHPEFAWLPRLPKDVDAFHCKVSLKGQACCLNHNADLQWLRLRGGSALPYQSGWCDKEKNEVFLPFRKFTEAPA